MKLKAAIEIGKECGLATVAESYNNVRLHSLNLFVYDEARAELEELFQEAKAAGVRFCEACGAALLEDGRCYMADLTHREKDMDPLTIIRTDPCKRCGETGIEPAGEHKGKPCQDCAGEGWIHLRLKDFKS